MILDEATDQSIGSILKAHSVVLFMKGTPEQPQCGFSASTISILDMLLTEYATVNVLEDSHIREGIKAYGQWPTIPQLYVNSKFIGGCDIVTEMFEAGELLEVLGLEPQACSTPMITFSESAAEAVKQALSQQPELDLHLRIDARWQVGIKLEPAKEREIRVDTDGISVLMDPSTAERANGLRIDVVDSLQGKCFNFDIPNAPPPVKPMSASTLKQKLDAGEVLYLFDVRGADERAIAQIENARPLNEEADRFIKTLPKKTALVFHCHTGIRSQAVTEKFRLSGFKNVYNLEGGIEAWSREVDAGVPCY